MLAQTIGKGCSQDSTDKQRTRHEGAGNCTSVFDHLTGTVSAHTDGGEAVRDESVCGV